MAIRITGTQFEALVQSTEKFRPLALPVGIAGFPINPLVFQNDWSVEFELKTTWQTDVTESLDQHQDRWVLQPKPMRTLTARFIGGTKAESEAVLNSMVGAGLHFGFPVPIYPDLVEVTAYNELFFDPNYNAFTLRVYGDFSNKRFYREGRVMCAGRGEHFTQQSNANLTYAIVIELSPEHVKIVFNQGTFPGFDVTKPFDITPCMDVEMVDEASGVAETDGVFVAELTFTEVEGGSALPPSWPAVSATNADVLLPLCDVIDGVAVFPFNPDWTGGVEIRTRRLIESNKVGRTSVQDPSGVPFQEFSLSVMGYDRESCWRVVRFFDSMRGRGGHFYFEHPMKPWEIAIVISDSEVRIESRGIAESLAAMARHVIVTLQDGTRHVRKVTGVVELGDQHSILFDALPNADVVYMQPVYLCSFDSDTLNEAWATNTVLPSLVLGIVEDPTAGEVAASGDALGVTTLLTGYAQILDNTALLRAGSRCFDAYGKPSEQWPSLRSRVYTIEDSAQPLVNAGQYVKPRKVISVNNAFATLVPSLIATRNNGQPSIINTDFQFDWMLAGTEPIGDQHLWDSDDGWTLFICFTPGQWETTPINRQLFAVTGNNYSIRGFYDHTGAPTGSDPSRAKIEFSQLGGPYTTLPLTLPIGNRTVPLILTVRFSGNNNGRTLHVWVNGEPACSTGGLHAFMYDNTTYVESRWMHGFGFALPVNNQSAGGGLSTLTFSWGNLVMTNLIASYKRGLPISEINEVQRLISETYLAPISPSVLF